MAKGIYLGGSPNLVVNGDFETGDLTNWYNYQQTSSSGTISNTTKYSGEYSLEINFKTTNSGGADFVADVNFQNAVVNNHIYYGSAFSKVSNINSAPAINVGGNYAEGARSLDWQQLSVRNTMNYNIFSLRIVGYSAGDKIWFDDVKVYDLTAMYGAGNEPTQEWCDANLEALEAKSVARKVKKAYVGVDDKARKVKKGYIGVADVARPFFSSEKELVYYGTATDLVNPRYSMGSASNNNYALFAGGYKYASGATTSYSIIDGYDANLTKKSAVITGGSDTTGASVGEYAIFAGGSSHKQACAYNSTLVRTNLTDLNWGRRYMAGASVGDYALFAGGRNSDNRDYAGVDAYSSTLVHSLPAQITTRYNLASASVGEYALFAGGQYSSNSIWNVVEAYNETLTKSTVASLTERRHSLAGASVGEYALFAGGYTGSEYSNYVDIYDENLVKGTVTHLSAGRCNLASTSIDGFALFAGGNNETQNFSTIDAYDKTLTRNTSVSLSVARTFLSGASIGNYALFAGGKNTSGTTNVSSTTTYSTVDVYQAV